MHNEVHAQFGIVLEWEIRRVGRHAPGATQGTTPGTINA